MGTPLYMAPEQAHGETVDHRADLFGLGSVLYAMCTGRADFRADTTMAVLRRVCDDTPRPIREVNPEIPDWLVEIIDHLLEKQPDDRLQTADEVAELLRQHLTQLQHPTNTPPPRLISRRAGRVNAVRSRRWLVAGIVLLVAGAAFGATEATGVTQFAASVISIVRGDGTLVIEVNDPVISVTIEGEDVVITGAGPKEVRLKPGDYRLQGNQRR